MGYWCGGGLGVCGVVLVEMGGWERMEWCGGGNVGEEGVVWKWKCGGGGSGVEVEGWGRREWCGGGRVGKEGVVWRGRVGRRWETYHTS